MKFPAPAILTAFVSPKRGHEGFFSTSHKMMSPMIPTYLHEPIGSIHAKADAPVISLSTASSVSANIQSWVQETLGVPPAFALGGGPPTKEEISILREAFAAFYGANRDPVAAESLLSQSIASWQRQPADEQAGLYRVRGDCYMVSSKEQLSHNSLMQRASWDR